MKTTRLVRFIMLRGADKTITDKTHKTPWDCIEEVADDDNKADLRKMLGEPSKFECLMLQPPNRLTHKNPTTIRIYITVFVVIFAIQFLLVFPRLPFYMVVLNCTLSFLTLTFLTCVNCIAPGYVKNEVDFGDLVRAIEST
jgi:hypothetical protein